ncbi:unnamed protein product [Nyctereutes procyonoides]|uniref:(raccoon dog) hypothetical protein n=1 Tax=Nyctereutes procyonoides TaxID=34880 RepID=A0A811ZTB9_NYCPR|nr:unnamed protein product [Nyctereutes procyonoides]
MLLGMRLWTWSLTGSAQWTWCSSRCLCLQCCPPTPPHPRCQHVSLSCSGVPCSVLLPLPCSCLHSLAKPLSSCVCHPHYHACSFTISSSHTGYCILLWVSLHALIKIKEENCNGSYLFILTADPMPYTRELILTQVFGCVCGWVERLLGYPHFTDKETEAQRGCNSTCARSHLIWASHALSVPCLCCSPPTADSAHHCSHGSAPPSLCAYISWGLCSFVTCCPPPL